MLMSTTALARGSGVRKGSGDGQPTDDPHRSRLPLAPATGFPHDQGRPELHHHRWRWGTSHQQRAADDVGGNQAVDRVAHQAEAMNTNPV